MAKTRTRYIRDIHYKIIGVYYRGHTFTTHENYHGLWIDGKPVLSMDEFDVFCSDTVARYRLLSVAKIFVDTLNK